MNPQQASYQLPTAPHSSKSKLIIAVLAILLVAAIGFGAWAFMGKQDYKNKTDVKIAAAVESAKAAQAVTLQAQNDEKNKSPNKTFTGSATYGSISFGYPKTWSAYLDTTDSQPINAYFYPDTVPGTQSDSLYALRVELVNTPYAEVLNDFTSRITAGAVSSIAYVPPKLKGVANVQTGSKLTGTITNDSKSQGAMVILKVRDKTLKVYSQAPQYLTDFNDTVLASLTFAP